MHHLDLLRNFRRGTSHPIPNVGVELLIGKPEAVLVRLSAKPVGRRLENQLFRNVFAEQADLDYFIRRQIGERGKVADAVTPPGGISNILLRVVAGVGNPAANCLRNCVERCHTDTRREIDPGLHRFPDRSAGRSRR